MSNQGKRIKEIKTFIQDKKYEAKDAFDLVISHAKEFESVDVSFVLGIDGKKSDQVVKGVVNNLPSGLGKKKTIAVFTKSNAKEVIALGADYAGFQELYDDIKNETINPDIFIATREIMPELAKLGAGRLLKSKMPNPKFGTVVEDAQLKDAIKSQKAGNLPFRSNGSLIHASIGRATFSGNELFANYQELLKAIIQSRPTAVKPHNYLKRIFISTTMGPSVQLDIAQSGKGQ